MVYVNCGHPAQVTGSIVTRDRPGVAYEYEKGLTIASRCGGREDDRTNQ